MRTLSRRGPMQVVCSVCKRAMGTKEGPEDEVSHGLCSAHCEALTYDLAGGDWPLCGRCDETLTPDDAAWIGEGEELVCRACAEAAKTSKADE